MNFIRSNGLSVNLDLVVSVELDNDTLVLKTENREHSVHFDSAEEAQKAYEGLAPSRAPASRRKPRTTR